ncbi:hypothetical protein [Sphingopyxis chilensis]
MEQAVDAMGEPFDARESWLKPTRHQVDRERSTVHFDEERLYECAQLSEVSPVLPHMWLEEATGEEDEQAQVHEKELEKPAHGLQPVHVASLLMPSALAGP